MAPLSIQPTKNHAVEQGLCYLGGRIGDGGICLPVPSYFFGHSEH